MYPYIQFFQLTIPSYGLAAGVGALAAIAYVFLECRRLRLPGTTVGGIQLAVIWGVIGTFLGAKLLYLLINAGTVLETVQLYGLLKAAQAYVSGGFVFYGGLIGAVLAVYFYARFSGTSFDWLCSILVPVIPLFHCFGRIGCFLEGCCYGKESALFGIVFTRSPVAPNGVPLIPVQLLEAGAELGIFLFLMKKRSRISGQSLLAQFVLLYTSVRFFLEFLRGDSARGVFWGVSISQVLSVLLFLWALCLLHGEWKGKEANIAKKAGSP